MHIEQGSSRLQLELRYHADRKLFEVGFTVGLPRYQHALREFLEAMHLQNPDVVDSWQDGAVLSAMVYASRLAFFMAAAWKAYREAVEVEEGLSMEEVAQLWPAE